MVAANTAVNKPMIATTFMANGVWLYRNESRAIMYTPAVTMVAAWMRADTGVGPAIASGSQTYSGNWADFPIAPTNSSMVIAVNAPSLASIGIPETAAAT